MNILTSPYAFDREKYVGILPELMPLLPGHWAESGEDREHAPLDPDYQRYAAMEANGMLRIYTVRRFGQLVGYAVYFVFLGLHAKTVRAAVADMLWIAPQDRRPGLARRFVGFIETQLRADGVKIMHTGDNEEHGRLGRLLERMGHKPVSRTYAKWLGGDDA